MKLTQDRIQQAAENKDVFSAGKTLYEQEKTDISKIDSFWKNEVYITASVHETDTAGKESVYRTRIFLKNDAVDNCLWLKTGNMSVSFRNRRSLIPIVASCVTIPRIRGTE